MSQEDPKRGDFAQEEGEIVLRNHEYDGIQEYDQKLPNWWLFTFYGAVAWFVVHWVLYYHTDLFKSPQASVEQQIIAVQHAKEAELEKTLATLDDSTLVHDWAQRPEIIAAGETSFMTHCTACHGADLSGTMVINNNTIPLPGLSLTDHEWKFGGKPMDIFKIINEGSPLGSDGNRGAKMQAWSQQLSPKQTAEIVAYIIAKVPEDFEDISKP